MKKVCVIFSLIFLLLSCGENKLYELDLEKFPSMDFDESVKYFETSDKPILIYFNGFGCVNCRKFEKNLEEGVGLEKIKLKYDFINLHTDDRTRLPESEWFESIWHGTVKTKGMVNAEIQMKKIQIGNFPYLAIMDKVGKITKFEYAYGMNIKEFLEIED